MPFDLVFLMSWSWLRTYRDDLEMSTGSYNFFAVTTLKLRPAMTPRNVLDTSALSTSLLHSAERHGPEAEPMPLQTTLRAGYRL